MIAQWPAYLIEYCRTFPNHHRCNAEAIEEMHKHAPFGPMASWEILGLGNDPFYHFDGDFIVAWGARYTPMIRFEAGQWWRWVSSFYVHLSRKHIVGNLTLFIPVGGLLEYRFGPHRFLIVLIITIIGGNMFSALLEEECYFYAGASSGVYGVIGMQLADAVYNYDRTPLPLGRMILTTLMIGQNVYQEMFQDVPISAMSHIGSCVMGFLSGFGVMMTHAPPSKWQLIIGIIGLVGLVVWSVSLPLMVYGIGTFSQDTSFAGSSYQCCYNPPEYDTVYGGGWDKICRSFPRPQALHALPIKYNLHENQTWWVTGESFTSNAVEAVKAQQQILLFNS